MFGEVARAYERARPDYPPAAARWLVGSGGIVLELGAGTGKLTRHLVGDGHEVLATDPDERMLAVLRELAPKARTQVGSAEEINLPDRSIDVIAVAQALHWFDLPAFYREVQRVARPGAVIAAWTYDLFTVDAAVDEVVRWFYGVRVGPYWPPERRHVESRYTTLDFPFPAIPIESPPIEAWLDRTGVTGFVATWSALARARDAEAGEAGERGDPLEEFARRLSTAWPDANERRLVRWPMIVLAGRVHDTR